MPRVGTLLDQYGRPGGRIQIIRKGKTTTRIKRSTDHGRAWSVEEEQVDSGRVVDDGGKLWAQHAHNPKQASYLNLSGEPAGRLLVQRVYKTVVKARFYQGNQKWGDVEDVHPDSVRFDGGASGGWRVLGQDQPASIAETDKTVEPVGEGPVQGVRVSYIRVSSTDQNLARQRESVGVVDREFVDEVSARSRADRPGLDDCLGYLREGDRLQVASIDRLARSLVDLRSIIDQITGKGASVYFVKEHLTFSAESVDPRATLMLGVLGSFAEFERSIIKERQAEGIALARKAGKYKGRTRASSPDQVEDARRRVAAGESKVAIAAELGIGRATLYRALAQEE